MPHGSCLSLRSAFVQHNVQGDVIFLLLESHLQDLGMRKIGDRLYFMEVGVALAGPRHPQWPP